MKKTLGIFLFRKDLRLFDNLALIELSKYCTHILPIFIFDNYQIDINNKNKYYRSNNAIQFLCESIIDLNKQLDNKLSLFKGDPIKILTKLFNKIINDKYDDIYLGFNLDYTKYALKRDSEITNLSLRFNIKLVNCEHDHILIPFNNMIKKDNTAYMVFGPFYKNAIKKKVNLPILNKFNNYIKLPLKFIFDISKINTLYNFNKILAQRGGRKETLNKLHNKNIYNHYDKKRDLLTFDTYKISAGLNFGCISIREFYHIIKFNTVIKKQLYWRDYYTCILRYIPNANSYSLSIDNRFDKIKWPNNYKNWKLMMQSKTGFLIIDAGIKELISTGYIGNRIRLLLATFWIKYLLIHPLHNKWGAHVGFSRYLVDCNTSQNKLNHQWFTDLDLSGRRFAKKNCNSLTGRMMRIDNEVIKQFDSNCLYIKKWIPELKNIPNKDLYKWNNTIYTKYKVHYPPIFDWKEQYTLYCKLF